MPYIGPDPEDDDEDEEDFPEEELPDDDLDWPEDDVLLNE